MPNFLSGLVKLLTGLFGVQEKKPMRVSDKWAITIMIKFLYYSFKHKYTIFFTYKLSYKVVVSRDI